MEGFGAGSFDFGDLGGSAGNDLGPLWSLIDGTPDSIESNQGGQLIGTSVDPCSALDWVALQDCFQASGGLSSSVAMPDVFPGDHSKQNCASYQAGSVQMGASFHCTGAETSYGHFFDGSGSLNFQENSEILGSQVANSCGVSLLTADNSLNYDGADYADWSMYSPPTNFKYETQIQNFGQLSDHMHYCMPCQEVTCFKDEQVSEGGKSFFLNGAVDKKYFVRYTFSSDAHKEQSPSSTFLLMLHLNVVNFRDDEENVMDIVKTGVYRDGAVHNARIPATIIGGSSGVNSVEQNFQSCEVGTSGEMEPHRVKDEKENGEPTLPMDTLKACSLGNSKDCRNNSPIDGGQHICIIEEDSEPSTSNKSLSSKTEACYSQHPKHQRHRAGSMKRRPHNDRFYRRVGIQDFSQPKSEATPPEGVLAVPLLRHQRIALSWMISQETTNLYCSGGILADDQGLGKTVSTIALILKERPPPVRKCVVDIKKVALETLNLDDDDDEDGNDDDDNKADGGQQSGEIKQELNENEVNGSSNQSLCSLGQAKGRPAAGTLIVCPTSVLRQWADELGNKVTSEANLSVLLYHGKRRTKDPDELAKYDVVLTTYSIVSMEFPKRASVDEDENEKERSENDDTARMGLLSSKKRKPPTISNKRGGKLKKGVVSLLFDSVSGPLAKVAWFRVVLDEAQSIKNHRTQVARACWSLRAKRRWCLSGTPIQNAVDDFYSYFRFLRCNRYNTYKDFCSRIKDEISQHPKTGYMRLQAVLKLIMLRRTKGTLLDGQPIISLPPKVVELRKVEFSKEEREFYTRLESQTFAQFKEYAAAGTVKENYVNILLMLLRLRQACDHPALVNDSDSRKFSSAVLKAKKLPHKKQKRLLRCLGGSLALCIICSDPPEDAVVTICGHVFCNQCISEHLLSDDKQCPAIDCKVLLSPSSVFSKATLENQVLDSTLEESVSVEGETVGPCSEINSCESAKINAAIQVLQSFVKPQDHISSNGCEISTDLQSGGCNVSLDKRKMETCEALKDTVKVFGDKAIVFSQWTRMLDLFETGLKNCSITYRRLDGTMSVGARDIAVRDFNTLPEVSVIIMSLKAASLGLNLVAASHVILLDLWWNPTTEDQAIDRAHRIGQTKPVRVLRLTVKDTIEDRILALQKRKRKMVSDAFGEKRKKGTSSRKTSRFTVEDLQFLFNV